VPPYSQRTPFVEAACRTSRGFILWEHCEENFSAGVNTVLAVGKPSGSRRRETKRNKRDLWSGAERTLQSFDHLEASFFTLNQQAVGSTLHGRPNSSITSASFFSILSTCANSWSPQHVLASVVQITTGRYYRFDKTIPGVSIGLRPRFG
jgi:hypothetical protein